MVDYVNSLVTDISIIINYHTYILEKKNRETKL